MSWLHTWVGLLTGWLLFFIFLTGTAGYFDTEIDRWMQPERPLHTAELPVAEMFAIARKRLQDVAPHAEYWFVLTSNRRNVLDMRIIWTDSTRTDGKQNGREYLEISSGRPAEYRQTGGGQLLYKLHYQLHYLPDAASYWIVFLCTMFMAVAIVTGVIVHKRIFRDFFVFRPRKGQRSWLDAHNLLSVLALPFHVMITYSGLVFFAYAYMMPVVIANYGFGPGNHDRYTNELHLRAEQPGPAGFAATAAPLRPMLDEAERRWGKGTIGQIRLYNRGDANARVLLKSGQQTPARDHGALLFDGVTGALLKADVARTAPRLIGDVLLGLHEGLFAGPALRWIYFVSGLLGTAMIGAGLVLWTTKRRAKSGDTFGFRLVEGLNIGTIVGQPVAIAAYFWANRLIPVGIEGRAAWEAHAMFIVWAVMLLHAFIRPASRGWTEQLWVAAGAFGLLPLLNALTTDKHLGVTLPAGAWELAGFDLTVLAFGIAFAVVAWRLGRRHRSDREHDQRFWTPAYQETEAAE
ncbi:PepSY-associated TM helix domain-containing protein [Hwanghaeella sp. LZ110]|uniref:PepSY-associated TM helix domain-containing protein n=1 Tax=Hwanghaeella sp. LZ110 TaxID=3402810 RepID=UPI003B685118